MSDIDALVAVVEHELQHPDGFHVNVILDVYREVANRAVAAEAERDRLIRCYEREADDGAEVGSLYLDAVRERDRLKAENSEYHDQAIRDYQQINRLKAALRAIADRISTPRELAVELRALADAGGIEETSA